MDAERWQRLRDVFDTVMNTAEETRQQIIDALCGDDRELRAEVLKLLAAANGPSSFLDQPAAHLLTPGLSPGTLLCNRFELVTLLGRGGMGEVWRARDQRLREDVAIKTIASTHAADEPSIARFKREIQLARKVSHANVCRVYDLFEETNSAQARLFLTMECLDGETLAHRLKRGPIPQDDALRLFRQIAAGVAAAHEKHIVHRDLKPSNIMLVPSDGSERAVVMDFGLARAPAQHSATGHTATGAVIGTPEYMAPEQIAGGTVTEATDVYALGLLLFEMLTATRPFSGGTTFDSWLRRAREGPRRISRVVPGVRRRIDDVIARCLDFEPANRYRNAAELLVALDSPWNWMVAHQRRPLVIAGAVLGVASIVAVAVDLGLRMIPPTSAPPAAQRAFQEGEEALGQGALVRARNSATRAIELAPRFPLAHVLLAETFLDLDMPARAQEAMLKAAELAPDRSRLSAEDAAYVEGIQKLLLRGCNDAVAAMQRFVDAATAGTRPLRLLALGRVFERCDRPDDALKVLSEAGTLDSRNASVPLRQARLFGQRRRYDEAFKALDRAEMLFRDSTNAEGLGDTLTLRGTLLEQQDRLPEADTTLAKASDIARTLDDVRQQIRVLLQQAIVRRKTGDTDAATMLTAKAIDLARTNNLEPLALEGMFAAANVHIIRREPALAQPLIERALTIAETYRHEEYRARAHLVLASLFVSTQTADRAEQEIKAARPYFERVGHTRNLVIADLFMGQIRIFQADAEQAQATFRSALASAERAGDTELALQSREYLATALRYTGDYPAARAEYETIAAARKTSGRISGHAYALLNVADLSSRLGDADGARQLLAEVARLPLNDDVELRLLMVRAALARRIGDARTVITVARDVLRQTSDHSSERAVHALEDYCLAETQLTARVSPLCAEMLARSDGTGDRLGRVETQLVAAEAYLMARDLTSAREFAAHAAESLGPVAFHERWRLHAIMHSTGRSDRERTESDAQLTRELDRLRLLWGETIFNQWKRRADVARLLPTRLHTQEGL